MYDILFICKHCGIHLSADENDVGITLPCPDCAKEISIPTGDILFDCPSCGKTLLASADSKDRTFQCPSCYLDIIVPKQGRFIPSASQIELEPPQRPPPQPTPPTATTPQPATPILIGTEKAEKDQFMMTWGSYLAEAGLTDEKDQKESEQSVPEYPSQGAGSSEP